MSSGMNLEEAKEYAKTMSYRKAINNIRYAKGIAYRKATRIKLRELAEIADRLDRKTENSSEKPNNCEDLQDWKDRMWAEAIVTEPTSSKMEQVDEPQAERSE